MKYFLVVFLIVWDTTRASNNTHQQNISKRGINDQVSYYTDPIQLRFVHTPVYRDVPPTSAPTHLYFNPKVIEGEYPKQVGVQQVLYDYHPQQIHSVVPTSGISDHMQASTHLNQHPNIITPVQHGAVINHGPSYPKYVYPITVSQTTNTPLYTHANKFIYPRPNAYPQQPAPAVTQKPFKPSPLIYISKPIVKAAPVKEETDEDEEPRKSNVKDEDDDNEELENYEEDEEDEYKFNKYRDEDEDDDNVRGRYKDDDDDEDNRSYSRNVRRKPRKPSSTNKYSSTKKPKSHYKSYRHSSYSKPKKDTLESRQTENIPVVHKHNSFREEKWIVTKKD